MNEENFQAIAITGWNRSRTGPILTPDYKILASFCFTLSATPSEEWIHVFDEVRQARGRQDHSSLPPRTRIDSPGIIITCRPDDLQPHYDRLKEDVAATNQKYRAALEAAALDEDLYRTMDDEIDNALGKLRP